MSEIKNSLDDLSSNMGMKEETMNVRVDNRHYQIWRTQKKQMRKKEQSSLWCNTKRPNIWVTGDKEGRESNWNIKK